MTNDEYLPKARRLAVAPVCPIARPVRRAKDGTRFHVNIASARGAVNLDRRVGRNLVPRSSSAESPKGDLVAGGHPAGDFTPSATHAGKWPPTRMPCPEPKASGA